MRASYTDAKGAEKKEALVESMSEFAIAPALYRSGPVAV